MRAFWAMQALLALSAGLSLQSATAKALEPSANVRGGGIDARQVAEPGSSIRCGHAQGLVKAPMDRVMHVLQDYGSYPRFMPNFEKTRVLSRRGSNALLFVQVRALRGLAELWAEVRVKEVEVESPSRRLESRMLRGNLKRFDASWQATPAGQDQTLVAFQLCANPDLPVPFADGLVSAQNEKEARRSIQALRDYLGSRKRRPQDKR